MSDFVAFSEEIDGGMEFLEHHGILGQRWGKLNGPPYPLGSGDHSSSEKSAAKAAGVTVGSDSGKGSIDNVKKKSGVQNQAKKPKKEMTEEEKREAALKAVRSGDKKKIAKYAEYLTSQELQDADNRVRNLSNIQREEPGTKKLSKAEMEKQEAIRSGDKEKVKQYADKMTYSELSEAMSKVDLMAKLNYTPPPPSAMDKLQKTAEAIGKFKDVAERGIGAYNVIAKIHNAADKDSQWPIIGDKPKEEKKEDKKEKKEKEETKEAIKKVGEEIKKTYEEVAREKYENAKTDYKYDKKLAKWKEKQEAKEEKKNSKNDDHEYVKKEGEGEDARYYYEEDLQPTQRQYTPERAPQVRNVNFNQRVSRDFDDTNIWNSVEEASRNSRPISDDLTPAEQAFLDSFREGR